MSAPAGANTGGPAPSGRDRPWSLTDTAILAVTIGLCIGLGEVVGLAWRHFVREVLTHITPQVVWMAPLGYASAFLILVPVIALARLAPAGRGPGFGVAVFLGLGLVGWLEMFPYALHPIAVWLLAFGVAIRIGLSARSRSGSIRRATRILTPVLSILVASAAVVSLGLESRRERRALDELGAWAPEAPNVLLLILDTVRAKSLGLYGRELETSPAIERLAEESIVFDRAISTAPWTLPSHASMFTGRWPHELSVGWSDPLDEAEYTLAEVLSGAGYSTVGLVANLSYGARQFGLGRGFARYEDFPITKGQVVLSTSLGRTLATTNWIRAGLGHHELLHRKTAADLRGHLSDWLDDRSDPERPFFAFMNFFDAHEPYEPPSEFRRRFGVDGVRPSVQHRHNLLRGVNARHEGRWAMSPTEIQTELALYEASIAYLDAEIGKMIADLDTRGLLDNTLIVLASDHGEHMGEKGLFGHVQSLYPPLTHVPLLIRPPGGLAQGLRIGNPVSLIDVPATIVDFAVAGASTWPGQSLRGAWDRSATGGPDDVSPAMSQLARGLVEQPWYPIARGLEMQSLVSGPLHYICNPDATEELYDLARDPEEHTNLVDDPGLAEVVRDLRSQLAPIGAPPQWCPPPPSEAPRSPQPRP